MAYTTIDDPSVYFQIGLYTGNGNDNKSINLGSANFTGEYVGQDIQPDWVWIKQRSGATRNHSLTDSTRGVTKHLSSDLDEAEATASNRFKSFDSNGFTLGDSGYTNDADNPFVAWVWKCNGGTRTTNTESGNNPGGGYQANTTAGFSIVDYTGTGAAGTMAHGLGAVPHVILFKARSQGSNDWAVYHHRNTSAPETDFLRLNTNGATTDNANFMNDTAPTSSVFTVNTGSKVNSDGETYIAYCFTEKQGYSKFGSYTSNNNADGPFVYTGFKPSWVMFKDTSASAYWAIYDNKRDSVNPSDQVLAPNASDTEDGSYNDIDLLSNGFKIRASGSPNNASSRTYIYLAFAESPFVSSKGVPTTAR